MDFNQNTQPEPQNEQPSLQNQLNPGIPVQDQTAVQDTAPAQPQSYGSDGRVPYQNSTPYQNGNPYQPGNPYSDPNADQNRNGASYGNGYNNNSYNSNNYYNNNSYYNGYNNNGYNNNGYNNNGYNNNGYPYYNRNSYQLPNAEPGSSFASAAMVLGIVSIVSCFTFTIYPAFVCGSIAVVLALLSKGRRPKLLSKAQTGITLAAIGLALNTVLVVASIVLLFTNPDVREEVNRTFQRTYGQTFDEMMEEIMEQNEDSN